MNSLTVLRVEPSHREPSLAAQDQRPRAILVVDDEEAILRVLSLGMQAHGFAVLLASDAPTAIELYRRNRDAIDMVLLDVRMPNGDGPETLTALREVDPYIPCCFMSGDTGKYTEEGLLKRGAMAVFRKPLRLSELARQLKELVGRPARPDAVQECRWEDDGGRGKDLATGGGTY